MQRCIFLILLIILVVIPIQAAHAQNNSLCVLAFEDVDGNGIRGENENPFAGINVNLALDTDVIFATHITGATDEAYCFSDLPAGTYHLYFEDSVNHVPTTQTDAILPIETGQRLNVEFGALRAEPLPTQAEVPIQDRSEGQLDTVTRVLLGLFGAILIMVLMIGFGAILVSFIA